MRWEETVAAECRWSELVEKFLGKGDVLLDNSYADYQGEAQVIVAFSDGRVAMYGWSYGSCSGCDSWEDKPLAKVSKEIEDSILWFDSPAQFMEWLDGPVVFRQHGDYDGEVDLKAKVREELGKWLDRVYGPRIH